MGAKPILLNEMIAGFGRPVVPEVYMSISVSTSLGPERRMSGGRSELLSASIELAITDGAQETSSIGSMPSPSIRQIERIPLIARMSLIPATLVAISLSKTNVLASAAVMQ